MEFRSRSGRIAQLVERFVYTEDAGGSSPSSPTIFLSRLSLKSTAVVLKTIQRIDSRIGSTVGEGSGKRPAAAEEVGKDRDGVRQIDGSIVIAVDCTLAVDLSPIKQVNQR